ncbi:Disease resistance protein RUN1 [Linum perenne]
MGGVGKTTLAKACYGRITSSNKSIKHLFIRNITEICGKHQGVEEVVRKLYSKLLDESNIDYEDLDITYRRERLSRMRVFIVFDNVETLPQLEQLGLGDVSNLTKIFAAGSRIVVTTRNKKVLQNAMTKIYDLECLNDEESTRLFSLHAFKQDFPQDNWTDKSRLAISYCKGNPLALKILGGALFGEDTHYWKSFLSGLRQTGQLEIQNVLRKSYDTLGATEKKIFLDVACLFRDISRSELIAYMETIHSSSCAKVKDLTDRSLLTCVSGENGKKIEVHDLLKEMAWNIVNEEPKLGKRSRLVDPDDIHKLLTTREVKSWSMSYLNVTHCPEINSRELEELNLDKTSLLELPSAVYNVKQNGDLYLYGKNIINFPAITRLRTLLLKHTSIRETDFSDDDDHQTSSVLAQSRFRALYLHENSQLESMPKSIWNMVSRELVIKGSPLLESLPEILEPIYGIHEMGQLAWIELKYCKSLKSIPSSIQKLSSLTKLIMVGCESIRSLPELPPNVCTLELSGCKSLQALPSNTGNLMKLGILQFENCPQLDQTIPIEIVTNFFVHARLAPIRRVGNGEFQQSRSELPKWFSHRSMNLNEAEECIVRMELPLLKDGDQSMIKGIVFGAVYSSHYNGYVTCGCEVGNTIVAAWISSLWDRDVSESDKLWLMFSKKLPGNCAMGIDENEAWYVKFAGLVVSFKFYIEEPKKLKVKGCGVSFLY